MILPLPFAALVENGHPTQGRTTRVRGTSVQLHDLKLAICEDEDLMETESCSFFRHLSARHVAC